MNSEELRLLGEAYVKITESQIVTEEDERSPEVNAAKQEAAKRKAERERQSRQKPITAGGGAPEEHGQVERYRNMARERAREMQNNSVDLFDIVKGHLMSEGFADTEEAALAIMANMSENWRNEIVESMVSANRMKELEKERLANPAPSVKYPAKPAPYGGARSREFEKRLPKPEDRRARSREFEHGSTRSLDTPSGNLGDGLPRDSKGNIMR